MKKIIIITLSLFSFHVLAQSTEEKKPGFLHPSDQAYRDSLDSVLADVTESINWLKSQPTTATFGSENRARYYYLHLKFANWLLRKKWERDPLNQPKNEQGEPLFSGPVPDFNDFELDIAPYANIRDDSLSGRYPGVMTEKIANQSQAACPTPSCAPCPQTIAPQPTPQPVATPDTNAAPVQDDAAQKVKDARAGDVNTAPTGDKAAPKVVIPESTEKVMGLNLKQEHLDFIVGKNPTVQASDKIDVKIKQVYQGLVDKIGKNQVTDKTYFVNNDLLELTYILTALDLINRVKTPVGDKATGINVNFAQDEQTKLNRLVRAWIWGTFGFYNGKKQEELTKEGFQLTKNSASSVAIYVSPEMPKVTDNAKFVEIVKNALYLPLITIATENELFKKGETDQYELVASYGPLADQFVDSITETLRRGFNLSISDENDVRSILQEKRAEMIRK